MAWSSSPAVQGSLRPEMLSSKLIRSWLEVKTSACSGWHLLNEDWYVSHSYNFLGCLYCFVGYWCYCSRTHTLGWRCPQRCTWNFVRTLYIDTNNERRDSPSQRSVRFTSLSLNQSQYPRIPSTEASISIRIREKLSQLRIHSMYDYPTFLAWATQFSSSLPQRMAIQLTCTNFFLWKSVTITIHDDLLIIHDGVLSG